MTTEEAGRLKLNTEHEIRGILQELMDNTGCIVSAVGLTVEVVGIGEYSLGSPELTEVDIKLEIR